ncbi:MAG TPA: FtsQ-type POTRA domain-containing protein [Spirochaetota bacterium]|nr:FtsQ-type POTRA domain-containing protein [Spirochaetota bacterium]
MSATILFALYVLFLNFKPYLGSFNFFTVKKVKFTGLQHTNPAAVLERLNISADSSLVFLNKKEIKERIEQEKRFKVIKIERELPDTLAVALKEVEGDFLVYNNNNFYELDHTGRIIAAGNDIYNYNKPVIRYSSAKSFSNFSSSPFNNIFNAINSLPETEKDLKKIISDIYIAKDIFLFPRRPQLVFNLGMRVNKQKIRKTRYALLVCRQKKRYKGYNYIDLRFNNSPVLFGNY